MICLFYGKKKKSRKNSEPILKLGPISLVKPASGIGFESRTNKTDFKLKSVLKPEPSFRNWSGRYGSGPKSTRLHRQFQLGLSIVSC